MRQATSFTPTLRMGGEGSSLSSGVVTIVPRGWDVLGTPVAHIAGHCLDVVAGPPGGIPPARYRNVYVHPDRRAELLRRMAVIAPYAETLITGGDFNTQLTQPRNDE